MDKKITQIISALKAESIPGELYIEGSYANGTEDQYSDIDLALKVDQSAYTETTKRISKILQSLDKPVFILDYGEDEGFPGFYYFFAIYNSSGSFKIIDLCILDITNNHTRGKSKLLHKNSDRIIDTATGNTKSAKSLTKKQKNIVKFYFLQPGIVKKLIRNEPNQILKETFKLKLLDQIKPFCTQKDLDKINGLIDEHEWKNAFVRGLKLFNKHTKKYQPHSIDFRNLKKEIEGLSNFF
ncbi:nucleotidyltransferase domain-containing protein [Patescibacteria group bacterium]|nr:nucleotidyltransferase domain-containing protein [Patescibacteria group bacterium]